MWSSLFYTTTDVLFQPASRRLANWAYYNWMVAYNLSLLLLFLAVDLVSASRSDLNEAKSVAGKIWLLLHVQSTSCCC